MIKNRSYNQQSRRFSLYLQFRPKMHNPFVHEKAAFTLPRRQHEAKVSVFMVVIPFRKDVSWQETADEFIYFKMAEGRAERTIRTTHIICRASSSAIPTLSILKRLESAYSSACQTK